MTSLTKRDMQLDDTHGFVTGHLKLSCSVLVQASVLPPRPPIQRQIVQVLLLTNPQKKNQLVIPHGIPF